MVTGDKSLGYEKPWNGYEDRKGVSQGKISGRSKAE